MLSKTSEADGSTLDRSVVVYCCRSPEAIGCVLTDLQMPKRDRADLEKVFAKSPNPLPVVFVAGKGDIPSVRAMWAGAENFFTKRVAIGDLVAAIERTDKYHSVAK